MFGFGFQKLLLLALLVGAVWYGFKFFGRLDESRKRVERVARKAAGKAARRAEAPADEPAAQDMERCETCGDYVAAAVAGPCGRDACPYPG